MNILKKCLEGTQEKFCDKTSPYYDINNCMNVFNILEREEKVQNPNGTYAIDNKFQAANQKLCNAFKTYQDCGANGLTPQENYVLLI